MGSRVALVGWTGAAPRGLGAWDRVAAEARAFPRLRGRSLVVLGDDALAALDPRVIADHLVGSDARLLLCPSRCTYDVLVPWLIAGVGSLTTTARLSEDVNRVFAAAGRPRLAPPQWLGRVVPPEVDVAHAIAALDSLDRLSVDAWAAASGLSRHALARICERRLGSPASEVVWRYAAATARSMRDEGSSVARIADALGYSEASALVRAFRRRGERLEPRGRGAATDSRGVGPFATTDNAPRSESCIVAGPVHHVAGCTGEAMAWILDQIRCAWLDESRFLAPRPPDRHAPPAAAPLGV